MKKLEEFNASDRVDTKLLEKSTHFLTGEITTDNVNAAIKWIVYENLEAKERTLTLYINSTGGDLCAAFGLIDIMNTSRHPVRTIGVGSVMSAAFLIFASGYHGERYLGTNTSVMCHQFSGETPDSKYHDIKAVMKENDSLNTRMTELLKQVTGMDTRAVRSKLLPASDVYLTAQEAVDLGVADHILQ